MENKYYLTKEQLNYIKHYKRMFEDNADLVKGLCSSEKEDIVYGFELGKMYSHLRECFIEMLELESEILNQEINYPNSIEIKKQIQEVLYGDTIDGSFHMLIKFEDVDSIIDKLYKIFENNIKK